MPHKILQLQHLNNECIRYANSAVNHCSVMLKLNSLNQIVKLLLKLLNCYARHMGDIDSYNDTYKAEIICATGS